MFLFRPFRSFRGVVRTRDTTGWARLVYALAEGGMGKRRAESNRPPQRLYRAPSMASSRLVHALVEEASGGGPAGSQWQNDQTQIGRRRDYQRQIGRKRVVQYLAQTGEGLRDGEIVEWLVAPGDAVKQYDLLCRVQSDKSTIDVTSAYEGTIESLSGSVGDVLNVGEPLCIFSVEEEEGVGMPSAGARSFVTTSNTANTLRRLPTLAEDPTPDPLCILSVEDKRGGMPDAGANPVGETPITTTNGPKGSLKRTLRSYRRSMMRSMQQASDIPHCHALDVFTGVRKISTPIAVKALSLAVECVPIMHATLSPEDESYTIPLGVHVGVAVSTPSGLAVPCLRDAHQKSVEEIGADIARLRRLAVDRRLSPGDTEGGTITLSNIGSVGLVSGLGIIQPKQTAIVTVGKAVDGAVHVSVSADHRLVDGSTLAEFLVAFRRALG